MKDSDGQCRAFIIVMQRVQRQRNGRVIAEYKRRSDTRNDGRKVIVIIKNKKIILLYKN